MSDVKAANTAPKVHVVILNWNGWRDTVECLESVCQSRYASYCTVVIDNGSEDDSCERIQAWANGELTVESRYVTYRQRDKPVRLVRYGSHLPETWREAPATIDPGGPPLGGVVLIRAGMNLGFAAGCNVGIRYAIEMGAEYVWILNNDTVVEPTALGELAGFLDRHERYHGVTGQIRLYDDPARIWNCGGMLTWYGARRYHDADAPVTAVPQSGHRQISFVTGCAVLFRVSVFRSIGMFSERFFFGEEDFELSQRLRRGRYALACRYDAVIYHKVGRAIGKAAQHGDLSIAFVYYLNRFIDMRGMWPRALWSMWRRLYLLLYIFPMLKGRHDVAWRELWTFGKTLLRDSMRLDAVDKDTFERLMTRGYGDEASREMLQ